MKKGDLYCFNEAQTTLVLVTKVFNRRDFCDDLNSFHGFPSIAIVSCVEVLTVSGENKGTRYTYEAPEFRQKYRKIEDANACR